MALAVSSTARLGQVFILTHNCSCVHHLWVSQQRNFGGRLACHFTAVLPSGAAQLMPHKSGWKLLIWPLR